MSLKGSSIYSFGRVPLSPHNRDKNLQIFISGGSSKTIFEKKNFFSLYKLCLLNHNSSLHLAHTHSMDSNDSCWQEHKKTELSDGGQAHLSLQTHPLPWPCFWLPYTHPAIVASGPRGTFPLPCGLSSLVLLISLATLSSRKPLPTACAFTGCSSFLSMNKPLNQILGWKRESFPRPGKEIQRKRSTELRVWDVASGPRSATTKCGGLSVLLLPISIIRSLGKRLLRSLSRLRFSAFEFTLQR